MKRKNHKRKSKLSSGMLETLKKIYGRINYRSGHQFPRLKKRGYLGAHGHLTQKAKKVLSISLGYQVI